MDAVIVVVAVGKFLRVGGGKSCGYVGIHQMDGGIGPEGSQALAFFRAFAGCDTVSFFSSRGRRSAWQTWRACPEAADAFRALRWTLCDVPRAVIGTLEWFVFLMCGRTVELRGVHAAGRWLFSGKSGGIEDIPPPRQLC